MNALTLWRDARLATFHGDQPWGAIENGAMLTRGEQIEWVGAQSDLSAGLDIQREYSLQGAWVTPGLIDAHTHLVYGGQRAHEFELRLQGAGYEEIARAGGGHSLHRGPYPRGQRGRAAGLGPPSARSVEGRGPDNRSRSKAATA